MAGLLRGGWFPEANTGAGRAIGKPTLLKSFRHSRTRLRSSGNRAKWPEMDVIGLMPRQVSAAGLGLSFAGIA